MKRIRLLTAAVILISFQTTGHPARVHAAEDTSPSVTVYPVSAVPNDFPAEYAKRVGIVAATFLERAGLEELHVSDTAFEPPRTSDVKEMAQAFGKHVGKRNSNQQRVLWETAKAVRDFIREHPPSVDYVIYGDYGITDEKARYVHVVICDASGQRT